MLEWLQNKSISLFLIWVTVAHLCFGLLTWIIWLQYHDESLIRFYFDILGALFFLGMSWAELMFCLLIWRQFNAGEAFYQAWFFIALSAGCHWLGFLFSQWLGIYSPLNPFHTMLPLDSPLLSEFKHIGRMIGGPIHMLVLAIGLFIVLRTLNHFRMLRHLTRIDYLLVGSIVLFTGRQLYEGWLWLRQANGNFSLESLTSYGTDPLLCVLLFEAILLRRASCNLGWGLVSKCWGAFTLAIFLTSAGNFGTWLTANYYLPYPSNTIFWFLWFPVYCTFTLAPAFQMEAVLRAQAPLKRIPAMC